MKHSLFAIFLFCLSCVFSAAQNSGPSIRFENTSHDFGTIIEANGSVTHTFEFTNNGSAALIVQNVKASCGCTTPDWTREPIEPGGKGKVTAEFDPSNRPGAFNKSLTIVSNANSQQVRLYIKGSVEPINRSSEEEYPIAIGGIRVKYRTVSFETLLKENPVVQSFSVYNDTKEPISFNNNYKAPDHIKLKFSPQSLPPHTVGVVHVTYDPNGVQKLGIRSDYIELKTDEWSNSVKRIMVIAFLEEYFPPMTSEQLAKAPRLIIANTFHDFGTIDPEKSITKSFVITNTGKEDLNIRQTSATCGCTASKPEKSNLKPGESSTIKVSFDPTGRSGEQEKVIFVFSNDPINPTQRITIKAIIAEG